MKCHTGIDPWGLPLEAFDAGGRLKTTGTTDTASKLPDGRDVKNFDDFRDYLASDRLDQVAFSVVKHLAIYANGRSLSYKEEMDFREQLSSLKATGYRSQDLIRFVIKSDAFLKK